MTLTLEQAHTILHATLAYAGEHGMKPISVIVLDARGVLKFAAAQDGTSLDRSAIAEGKGRGALSMGLGSRTLYKRAQEQPYFIAAATAAVGGKMVPVPGGVLIRDGAGAVIGAVGVSGDSSDNDEASAMSGIAAAGLIGEPGSD
jgi:uncharacterized protein GlcG (DUF336 family)